LGCATRVPAKPNTAPRARPTAATTFSGVRISIADYTTGNSCAASPPESASTFRLPFSPRPCGCIDTEGDRQPGN
jgi:hypothetical protein